MTTPRTILQALGFPCSDVSVFGYTRDCRPLLGEYAPWELVMVLRDQASGAIFLKDDPGPSLYASGPETSPMSDLDDTRREWFTWTASEGTRLLDFGCGAGGFMRRMKARGWLADGYDPALGHAPLPDSVMFVNDGVRMPLRYDVITAWHVVEHLRDPITELRRLAGYLEEGGLLIVEVPHAESWLLHHCEAHRQASLWSEHLILHTEQTLAALLQAAGLEVHYTEHMQRYSLSNALHWLEHGKGDGGTAEWDAADHEWAQRLIAAKQTDTLLMIGRKGGPNG